MAHDVFLHEELMLLALRDHEGTVEAGTMYTYGLGGAILAELILGGRLVVDGSGKRPIAKLASTEPFGEPLIDECLERVAEKKPTPLQTWVSRFSGISRLKHRVAEGLCRRGVLRADEQTILLVFSRKVYPEVDPTVERELTERLRSAIFDTSTQVDPRTVVLLSLANSTGLLKNAFDKNDLKAQAKRIDQVVNGEVTGRAAKEAIQAMQAAMMVAVIIPAIIVPTISH